MPIRVEIEGHGVAEFPDGTADDVIDAAVKRDFFTPRGASGSWEEETPSLGPIESKLSHEELGQIRDVSAFAKQKFEKKQSTPAVRVPQRTVETLVRTTTPGLSSLLDTQYGKGVTERLAETAETLTTPDALEKLPLFFIPGIGEVVAAKMGTEGVIAGAEELGNALRDRDPKALGRATVDLVASAPMLAPAVRRAVQLSKAPLKQPSVIETPVDAPSLEPQRPIPFNRPYEPTIPEEAVMEQGPSGLELQRPVPLPVSESGILANPAMLDLLERGKEEPFQAPAHLQLVEERGPARAAVEEMGQQIRREGDFPKAVGERVAEEQQAAEATAFHPDKALTENQLRIINDSLSRAINAQRLSEERPGIISGTRLEKWADDQLSGSGTHLGPDVLAAYIVKGAALLERGVTDFATWSAQMLKEYGPQIKSHLRQIYNQSAGLRSQVFKKGDEDVARQGAQPVQVTTGTAPRGAAIPLNIEGDSLKMRKSAERATVSPQIPEPVQERIAQSPESFYKRQPMASVEEVVNRMSDGELAAVPPESNFHVAARLTLATRLLEAGKLEEGYQVFKAISAEGTALGQNINQFKFLKGQSPLNYMRLVNEGLKETGKDPLTKDQATKLTKIGTENIESAKKLEKAKQDWQKDPTDANAKLADDALMASDKASLELQKEMGKYQVQNWPKMLKAFVQGNPLTPISHVANFLGNSLGAALEGGARSMAASLDIIRAALTGGERKIRVQPVKGTAEAAKGYGRGLAKVPGILARGPGQTVKGDVRAALRPLVALRNAFAKNPDVPTVGGKVPFNERARLAVEGTFGVSPEAMLRLLSAADKPAFESARARLIGEQLSLQKTPYKEWAFAQRFPELFIKPEELKRINLEAQKAIFQEPSRGVNALNSLIRQWGGDWADLAFTIMVAPYRLTPWNLIKFTLQYNPLWAAFKTAKEAAGGNTRAAELSAGRMLLGGMLYTAGYFLYKNGLVGPSMDERDESAKAKLLAGEVLPPNHVNISGLKRLMAGGDPAFKSGDETIDMTRGGGAAGAIISSVANIGRDFEKQPAEDQQWLGSLLQNSTLQQASFTINQSFLKGVTGILDAVRDRNLQPYMNGVENMLLNVATPNTLSTISRATRKYAPDMKAETLAKQFTNVVRNRFGFAGLDDYLPLKRDLWGKPMLQTPKDRNAILYHLFDISKGRQVTDDPVALELYSLWRTTADTKAIPSIPARTLTIASKTYNLTPEQYSRYAELVGTNRRTITEALVKNPNWQNADAQTRISVLDRGYDAGQTIGKTQFFTEFQGKLAEKSKKTGFR